MQDHSLAVPDKISTLRFAEVVFDLETLHKEPCHLLRRHNFQSSPKVAECDKRESKKLKNFKIMANCATNIFHASTENKTDLDKIEAFLDENFNGYINRYGDIVDAEFSSRWEYPEKEIDKLVASLEARDKIYIRILTHEFENEYVSFRIFSQGKWDIKL